jgi:hypothetical protein
MVLGYFLFFLAVIYEFIYINEDFLFIISFFIFFINVVNIVSKFLYSELTIRRNQLTDLLKFNVLLNKHVVSFNYEVFDFFHNFDLETDFNKVLLFIINVSEELSGLNNKIIPFTSNQEVMELVLADDEDLISTELCLLELIDVTGE